MITSTAFFWLWAAVDFWEKMSKLKGGKESPEFLSTHPSDRKRVEKLKKLLPKARKIHAGAGQQHGMDEAL